MKVISAKTGLVEDVSFIVNGICIKGEERICNLGYACDGCPYNQDIGGWQGCDSKSNAMCLARRCNYAKVPYLIDEGSPEVICTRPAEKKWNE